ncbi:lactate dehydrogenase-like 2-hydroxyacid dehydrogenase [Novosphingobium sp. SG751A]|uniref:2-hydroxyacid dehydrogenase n=1 Tax=Novosphingobium sp. SG751A TaxID=2587000 RepID=UPI0015530313|nr:2-hydroxyacid dehydrogenase [Novosphingobium sp. SG751A]NOW46987.1 lactate dehydrogenase-like 2-hydroxyacid dehydrogenase [Novosphingobium sp. SG751A]
MIPDEILITAPMLPTVISQLGERFQTHHLWEVSDKQAFLREIGPRIRGVATSTLYGRVGEDLLKHLPNAEIVASFGVGYDNIDVDAALAHRVVVTNTPGVLTEETADLALGLLLATIRQIPAAERHLRAGKWLERSFPLSASLRGRRVGILGLGDIGKAVARRLEGFAVDIAYCGRRPQDVPYAYYPTPLALARAVDVLIVLIPGGAATRHTVNGAVLDALGPDGVLINVARGSVVDTQALIAALREGKILTAGLDVFEDEPRVPAELLDIPGLVLLPHIGSASVSTRAAMGQLVVDNLVGWFEGRGALTPVAEVLEIL